MDAVKDGDGLGVDIHVFARGDGRERVDAGVEEVRGRLTGDKLARSVGTHPSDGELGVSLRVDADLRSQGVLHRPVIENAHRRLVLGDGEGMGEALPVHLHGGRHLTGLGVLVRVGNHVFDDQQRGRRGHGVVGQEDTLVARNAGINHGGRRTGLTGGQQIQVLAHLSLGRARTVDNLDRDHAADHQHREDTNEDPDQDRPLLAPAGRRRRRHASPGGR